MTSLSEVYEPDAEYETSLRRLYAGLGLFSLGTLLVVAGIVVAATSYGSGTASRELAGVLAGVGVPAVFLGIFAVLPAGRRTRAAAIVGAAVALVGVIVFVDVYPCRWVTSPCANGRSLMTLPVIGIYFSGTITTFFCLFVGVANFKSRNNPGGTAMVEVTAQGETRVIEVPKSQLSKFGGSLGVLGDTPTIEDGQRPEEGIISDGGADNQTVTEVTGDGAEVQRQSPASPASPSGPSGSTKQHGQRTAERPPETRRVDIDHHQSTGSDRDRYCGSCVHFQYVQTETGMEPYCGAHDVLMDDMEACQQYRPRSGN